MFLEIGFENCESIILRMDRVETFEYGDLIPLNESYLEENTHQSNRIHLKIRYGNEEELVYSPQNEIYPNCPLGLFVDNPTSNHVEYRPNIIGRILNYNDIVDITVLDKNENAIKVIRVPWKGNGYSNDLMVTTVENGILDIQIKN